MVKQNENKTKTKHSQVQPCQVTLEVFPPLHPLKTNKKHCTEIVCFVRLGETRSAECSTDATRRTGSNELQYAMKKDWNCKKVDLLHESKAMTNKHIFAFTGVDIPY